MRVPRAWYSEFEGTGHDADDRYVMVLEDLDGVGLPVPAARRRRHRGPHLRHRREPRAPARAVLGEPALRIGRRPRVDRAPLHRLRRRRRAAGADGDRQPRRPAPRRIRAARGDVRRAIARHPRSSTARASARSCTATRTSATSSSTASTRAAPASSTGPWSAARPASATSRTCSPLPPPPRSGARTSRRCSRATARCSPSTASRSPPTSRGSSTACSRSTDGARATCTVAMGSKWQPEHIGLGGTERGTIAALDLDCVGLLADRLA